MRIRSRTSPVILFNGCQSRHAVQSHAMICSRTDFGVLMSLKKLGLSPLGRRNFLKASVMAAAGATLTDRSLAQSLSPVTKARAVAMHGWSDQSASTTLFV